MLELTFYVVVCVLLIAGLIRLLKWAQREDPKQQPPKREQLSDPKEREVLGKLFDSIVDPIRKFKP